MDKIFNLPLQFKALETNEDDGSVKIRGMATTPSVDRVGDVIEVAAWTRSNGLENFKNNPIILFNHNYDKPIGRATNLTVSDKGLEIEAKISKSAPDSVHTLIKEGILGTFSVGFRVKDAEYVQETDGLKIKDAELFEVSVVSVPCNQAATFSLAKDFNSSEEYENFKSLFKPNADLASSSLAEEEANASKAASEALKGTNNGSTEIEMPGENQKIDLNDVATSAAEKAVAALKAAEEKAAAELAAKKEAEEKAAAEKAAAEKAAAEEVENAVKVGVSKGTENLVADFQKRLDELAGEKEGLAKAMAEFKTALEEKEADLTALRQSKAVFDGNGSEQERIQKNAKQLMYGYIAGIATGKGWESEAAKDVLQKAGLSYTAGSVLGIDNVVSQSIQQEIQLQLRVASLFNEFPVNAQSTVVPLQSDTSIAKWQNGGIDTADNGTGTGVTNRTANDSYSSNTYAVRQKVLQVDRLISTSFLDRHTDEKILINTLPMLTQSIARSHARAFDAAIINGNSSNIAGLIAMSVAGAEWGTQSTPNPTFSAEVLVKCRRFMGVYGLEPRDVVYIVSQDKYYDLLEDPDFLTIDEVGSDMATCLTGQVGMVFGSPVVITDNMPADDEDGFGGALAVHTSNFVIPRLANILLESDNDIQQQRTVLVGTQHVGFDELFDSGAGKAAAVYAVFNDAA